MKSGLILMTALLPTIGHKNLIQFGLSFLRGRGVLTVILSSRSFEPIPGSLRSCWLSEIFFEEIARGQLLIINSEVDEAPQNPEDHPDFWNWWKDLIQKETGSVEYDYVFASEPYGMNVADSLGAKFIPYDIARNITSISSTQVRQNPISNWDLIIDPAKRWINTQFGHFCIFGQESVGKTTIAKQIALRGNWTYQPEWARPFLETVGPEITIEKMEIIFDGQFAQMDSASGQQPISILDTDLLSTIGYMKFWNLGKVPDEWIDSFMSGLRSTHYFLLQNDAPFVPDPLRYGGDKRETDLGFWIDILKEFECQWTMVPTGTEDSKVEFINKAIRENFTTNFLIPLRNFQRE